MVATAELRTSPTGAGMRVWRMYTGKPIAVFTPTRLLFEHWLRQNEVPGKHCVWVHDEMSAAGREFSEVCAGPKSHLVPRTVVECAMAGVR